MRVLEGLVPHGFSRGGRKGEASLMSPTSKEMGHPLSQLDSEPLLNNLA